MAKFIKKTQCPACASAGRDNSKDNLAVYDDGSTYCFGCSAVVDISTKFIPGKVQQILPRNLDHDTCAFYDYEIGTYKGQTVHIANYYNDKQIKIAQKIRFKDKSMEIIGNGKSLPLYGKWKWSPHPAISITITEGEIDCLSVSQAQGHQYPVVSLPNGAKTARKTLEAALPWLSGFKHVNLAFDNDEPGHIATQECLELFEPSKVRITEWPLKDANDMLKLHQETEINRAVRNSRIVVPERIVTAGDIIDRVMERPQRGIDYPWPSLTDITYGFQTGEIHVIVGANGIGKTEFIKDLMFHFLAKDIHIGLFSFEQAPESTIRRLVGAKIGQKLHLPDAKWNEELVRSEALKLHEKLFLYDKAGSGDDEEIIRYIRYLAKAKSVKLIIIDNLKGLGGNGDIERMTTNMKKFQAMKLELGITIILLSHVAKDKLGKQVYVSTSPKRQDEYHALTSTDMNDMILKPGLSWESGRMPTKENVEGASAVCDLADYVFALARNTIADDVVEQKTLIVKTLKARLDGSKNGAIIKLVYTDRGVLEEVGHSKVLSINSGDF